MESILPQGNELAMSSSAPAGLRMRGRAPDTELPSGNRDRGIGVALGIDRTDVALSELSQPRRHDGGWPRAREDVELFNSPAVALQATRRVSQSSFHFGSDLGASEILGNHSLEVMIPSRSSALKNHSACSDDINHDPGHP